jgi:Carboxypeptidase regulatory-like domain
MPTMGPALMAALMRTNAPHHPWIAIAAVVVGVCLMLGAIPVAAQMPTQETLRTLSGVVNDTNREPIRGAVVELRNESSHELITYITEANGTYSFKRLDGNTDYVVWVVYRGHHSPMHSISKFDSETTKVINFSIRTY